MIQSTYYKVTDQIMLEYRTDQFNIINSPRSSDVQTSRSYIYKGLDGMLYYTEEPRYKDKSSPDYYKNQSLYLKFPDAGRTKYTYLGMDINLPEVMNWQASQNISNSVWIAHKPDQYSDFALPNLDIYYDSIRIYFLRGFSLNAKYGLDGLSLRILADASKEIETDSRRWKEPVQVCMLDYYIDANDFHKAVRYLTTPLYMNSKFYDSYVEVEFPSPYGVALSDNSDDTDANYLFWEYNEDDPTQPEIITLSQNAPALIEFSTISKDNSERTLSIPIAGRPQQDVTVMTLDQADTVAYMAESNTNYLNARIYEDSVEKCLIYYPTYGDPDSQQELDYEVYMRIETGEIPLTANGFQDSNISGQDVNDIDYMTDDLYYYDPEKTVIPTWLVYNDIVVSYLYGPTTGDEYSYQESYSRCVDYINESTKQFPFWRTRYVPNATIIDQLNVQHISIKYTCRLVNTRKGVEVIRVASLIVDAAKYTDNLINKLNIRQYKIYNKIGSSAPVTVQQQEIIKEKYIRSYYNATNLVARNVGTGSSSYPQGQMTLYLYKTSNNYLIQLYNLDDNNIRIPFDLTGPYKYKLVFPTSDGNKLSISPNFDSTKQNLGIGTLVFYISGDQAQQIMRVPADSRYFAIMTDNGNNSAQDTTLYEGIVEWIS